MKKKKEKCTGQHIDDSGIAYCVGCKKFEETRPMYEPYVDRANVCELAHELTTRDCERLGIKVDHVEPSGDIRYTDKAQDIFNDYLTLIDTTLGV